ncbi:transposase family protein [Cardinium endosymbiont of Tipula unca]|uniref:transposase family protein n=2 Tax=Cardinium endosymbiont of Tipula unca TaxID=3066216 RepID=UPI0030CF7D97
MALTYKKLSKYPHSLRRLVGIELSQLNAILTSLTPIWSKHLRNSYDRPGRYYKHDLGSMVSLLLIYYRSYTTQEFVGYLFDLDKSNVCRIIKKLEPLLATILPIPDKRILTKEEVSNLIIDVTEQPIERPKQGQEAYYSGKKKQHTVKKEIRIDQDGTIVHVSATYPGRVHDFAIFKQEPPPPSDVPIWADAGYQGIEKLHKSACTPYKSSKKHPLCAEKKTYNQVLASQRVLVEHKIRSIKVFKIIGNRYRNKRKRYDLKFNIVAGLVNLQNGLSLLKRAA